MLNDADLKALLITLQLAAVTTIVLLFVGTPVAWWLSRSRFRLKFLIEAVIALPLVLPPTVLGFYLLFALGPDGPIGVLSQWLGSRPPVFTFTGLVIGSVIYSFPFVVQPLQNAFSAIGDGPLEAAATLRASPFDRFFSVALPMARPGFVTAAVLGFAHTVGEFGVVLMIGGNIRGETSVVSIAIYDHVEALEYTQANTLAGLLLVLSFLMLAAVYGYNRRYNVIRI
ncbi:MAG: molybdate ABC transporter permease subunit [Acidobacteriota bacterium]|nr:molybdate ABC transporter permease subunit [Acidobacteriota bacterium]MDH3530521.1 molybdate ABC transporter permease subunit [Acidobacteriota bacterium]